MRKHIAWRGGMALPAAGISAARMGGMAMGRRGEIEMRAMDFERVVSDSDLPALPGRTAEDEICGDDAVEAVVFDATRSGMLNTTAGAARVALRLQFRRCGGGRMVAVMLAVGLTEHGAWTLRRISVPVAADRPSEAARLLGGMVPDVLTDMRDGIVLMSGEDGVVRAEVLSRSGWLVRNEAVEVDLRQAERAKRGALHQRSSVRGRFGYAQHRQHA
ncbi:MAG: hypothetical protein WBA73_14980 [Devosia sp.]